MPLRTFIIFLGLSLVAHAGWLKPDVDFSNYDVPLYEQIVDRIKAKISNRLGEGANTRDRYFIIPFAYENDGNDPESSHSFMSVIRVFADDKQPRLTQGLKLKRYKNREFEAFTISWLPSDFMTNPDLCVFKGTGARLFAKRTTVLYRPGETLRSKKPSSWERMKKNAVAMWGPYEIDKKAFDLAVKRKRLLDIGTIKYRADDRLYRKDRVTINCFHAIAGLTERFPNGGLFGTGFKMWGLNGTARVLIEYTEKANIKGVRLTRWM